MGLLAVRGEASSPCSQRTGPFTGRGRLPQEITLLGTVRGTLLRTIRAGEGGDLSSEIAVESRGEIVYISDEGGDSRSSVSGVLPTTDVI